MAQYNTTLFTNQIASPPTLAQPDDTGGRVRVITAAYTTTASTGDVAGSVIAIGMIPRGARVIRARVTVPASFLNTVSTLGYGVNVGGTVTVINATRFGTFPTLAAVGEFAAVPVVADKTYRVLSLTSTTDASYTAYSQAVLVWTVTTTDTGASKDICFQVEYVID